MAVAVGINGFGRIGRLAFRGMADKDIQIVGINDIVDAADPRPPPQVGLGPRPVPGHGHAPRRTRSW